MDERDLLTFFHCFFLFHAKETITSVKDNKKPRPLYDIPYMFEAREFLRKKLIGKKVRVSRIWRKRSTPALFNLSFNGKFFPPSLTAAGYEK